MSNLCNVRKQEFKIGNLVLDVAVGGAATISTGEKFQVVTVWINDKNYAAPQAGAVSANPAYPAKAFYEIEETKEALEVTCSLVQ
jgi:hypothetical protein